MRGLFLQTIAGIFGIIMLGILSLGLLVIVPALEEFSQLEYQEESSFEHQQLYRILADLPRDQWPQAASDYQSYFELTARLLAADELPADVQSFTLLAGQQGYFREDDEDIFYTYLPAPAADILIEYSEGDSELVDYERSVYAVGLLFLGPLVIILLAMLLGIAYLLHTFNRPLRALEAAMASFSTDTGVRLQPAQAKTLPNVVRAFNAMADQLEDTLTQQQVMIAAIPHELRTPIARIRFALDLLRGQSGDKLIQGLERLDSYADELQQASEDILLLNRLSRDALVMQPLDFRQLVQQSLTGYDDIQADITDVAVKVQGHEGLLRRALGNLLDNAVQHSQSYIKVALSADSAGCCLIIENDGAQLSEADAGRIFQAFYRADASRSRRSGGMGIGLTLVKQIVDGHQGQVEAQIPGEGIIQVKLKLPVF